MPSWYLAPKINNISYIYGTAYGDSLASAKKAALNDLTQKIIVDVSASMALNRQESSANGRSLFKSDSQQNIKIETNKIRLPNYELVKSEQKGRFIYALVQVRKQEIISLYQNELQKNIEQINLSKNSASSDLLSQKKAQLEISKIASKSYPQIMIIETLDPNNQVTQNITKLLLEMQKQDRLINKQLIFTLEYQPENENIARSIKKGLADHNIKLAENAPLQKATIKIKSQNTEQILFGSYFVKTNLTLQTYDYANNLTATSNLILSANSNISFTNAKQLIAQNLQNKINQEGVFTILNLN